MSEHPSSTLSAEAYDTGTFWNKASRYAKKAGREVVEKALWLHYAAQDEKTPLWAKTTIYGAIAYFVMPADAIPDFVPAAGFTDDLGAIVAALTAVAVYVTPEVKQRAAEQLKSWFGDETDSCSES